MTSSNRNILNYQACISAVLQYIDKHRTEPMSLSTLASVTGFSEYHFHRLFMAFVGESVGRYIRRVRLEWAANRLMSSGESVTDVAYNSGYETPASFTKAFNKHFGVSPSSFKNMKNMDITPKFSSSRKSPESNMQTPDIKRIDPVKVLFVQKTGHYSKAAEASWKELMTFAGPANLINSSTRIIGVPLDNPDITQEDKLRYQACISIDEDIDITGNLSIQTMAGGKYAVFIHKGSHETVSNTYTHIYSKWLPESGMELRDIPSFEEYQNSDKKDKKSKVIITEIYVPVI